MLTEKNLKSEIDPSVLWIKFRFALPSLSCLVYYFKIERWENIVSITGIQYVCPPTQEYEEICWKFSELLSIDFTCSINKKR